MATADADSSFAPILFSAQAGEGWAFAQLFALFEPSVAGFVRSRRVGDADDVVNDVFLAAFRGIHSFTGNEADFRAWLFRITRNKVADWFRDIERRRRQSAASQTDLLTRVPDDGDTDAVAGSLLVEELLATLTDEQREVLELRVLAGLTGPQTAELLDKPLSAVKALQRRALQTLRREISPQAVSNR